MATDSDSYDLMRKGAIFLYSPPKAVVGASGLAPKKVSGTLSPELCSLICAVTISIGVIILSYTVPLVDK